MALIWLRYGDRLAVTPMNCLYSACRGLLVDGAQPQLCSPPAQARASRGFFCDEQDAQVVRSLADRVERVSPSPVGNYYSASETVATAALHHRIGLAHIWLAPVF